GGKAGVVSASMPNPESDDPKGGGKAGVVTSSMPNPESDRPIGGHASRVGFISLGNVNPALLSFRAGSGVAGRVA
ncbi:MAG: hypothetical protein EB084_24510, partial [Proteobacteria bacterium]|nr:hypothetical protein [Pseudomonadota bacterium]